MLSWSSRTASGTQSVAVKTTVLWWLREITAVTLWLHRRHFFRRVMVLFGSFIGLADTEGEKKNMLNEYALSALHWFFPFCLLLNGFGNFTLFPSRSLFRKCSVIRHSRAACTGSFSSPSTPAGAPLRRSYSGVLAEKGTPP